MRQLISAVGTGQIEPRMDEDALKKRLGKALQSLREYRELSQKQLGARIGVDGRSIKRFESGENFMALPNAIRAAQVLGVTLDRLVDGVVQEKPHEVRDVGNALMDRARAEFGLTDESIRAVVRAMQRELDADAAEPSKPSRPPADETPQTTKKSPAGKRASPRKNTPP